MTDPKLAHSTPWGRMYARDLHSKPLVPSITTVIGMSPDLPSPDAKTPELGVAPNTGHLGRWKARIIQDATAAYLRRSDDLYAKYPHIPRAVTAAKEAGRNHDAQARAARNAIAATPDVIANAAAERGDRVHEFAEAIGQWQLGIVGPGEVAEKRADLDEHGEGGFADALMDWWMRWDINAVANEVTVWNHDLGVAGTLDIIFTIGGELIAGDFKTKETTDTGRAKPMQDKVGMQLLNALHADEEIVDPETGQWQDWRFPKPDKLMAIAVSATEVVPMCINPDRWDEQWQRFTHLRGIWQAHKDSGNGPILQPARPPATAANWSDGELATLPDGVGAAAH